MNSADVPQPPQLSRIRAVMMIVAEGATELSTISSLTGVQPRHIEYALASARILGFAERTPTGWLITPAGRGLLETASRSDEERRCLAEAIRWQATLEAILHRHRSLDLPRPLAFEVKQQPAQGGPDGATRKPGMLDAACHAEPLRSR